MIIIKKIIGILIILVGVLLLFANLNLIDFTTAMEYFWPLALMTVGITGMIELRKIHVIYLIIAIFGLGQLLVTLNIMEMNLLWLVFWPLALIMLGLSFFVNYNFNYKSHNGKNGKCYTAVFGGVEEKNNDKAFTSCEITAVFGGADVDFSEMTLKEDKAYMNITSLFGGVELIMPKKYKVTANGVPIFGACTNKLNNENMDVKKEIIINYTVIFGGIEIK